MPPAETAVLVNTKVDEDDEVEVVVDDVVDVAEAVEFDAPLPLQPPNMARASMTAAFNLNLEIGMKRLALAAK